MSGGLLISVLGSDFSLDNLTATTLIGNYTCSTTVWVSWTTMQCELPPVSFEGASELDVDVSTLPSEWTSLRFTYDAPVVMDQSSSEGAPRGRSALTVLGTNFGIVVSSPLGSIGSTACIDRLVWTTSTLLLCFTIAGSATDIEAGLPALPLTISVPGLVSTKMSAYTYLPLPEAGSRASPRSTQAGAWFGNSWVALSAYALALVGRAASRHARAAWTSGVASP